MEGITRERSSNSAYPIGSGYIVIPSDVDRDIYIETCYRKERVAVQLDDGGSVLKNCFIDKSKIQEIIFPQTNKELGSCVIFVYDRYKSMPIVIGIISKKGDLQLLQENSFKKSVRSDTGSVSVEGKAKDGNLFINVESDFENSGNIFINLKSKNNTSKFNVNCFGDISIYSEGDTSLETLKTAKITCNYIDGKEKKLASSITMKKGEITVVCERANIVSDNIRLGGSRSIVLTDLPAGSPIPDVDCLIVGNITGN